MMSKNFNFFLLCFFLTGVITNAQSPYVLNGTALQNSCNCYTLTNEIEFQSGSIWNKNKIDISKPFDYFFNVNMGCRDVDGADGIVFVLQPVSTSLGNAGEGMGFQDIQPSLGVTIDTYQNFNQNDPPYDHISIQVNGDVNHYSANNLAGPVPALATSDNIEDCNWHVLEVNWQPANSLLLVSMDGVLRLSLNQNIIASVFSNDPMVYWGFTSATGGEVNVQQMCTSLNANYVLAAHNNTCIGTPLGFIDSSVSFGSISNWYWNFGDGTTSPEKNPPLHLYDSAGVYDVTLNVKGADGCTSDTFRKQITVGSFPVADFKINNSPICTNRDAIFTDATILDVGTENYWYWNFGNGIISYNQSPPPVTYNTGNYTVHFFVKTLEGCASDTASKSFTVAEGPLIDFTKNDGCKNDPVFLVAENLNKAVGIDQWYWDFGDEKFSTDSNAYHIYADGGAYNVSLVARAVNECISDTITKPVAIYATNAYAGNDTTILQSYPYQLHATGGDTYVWSPSTGLDNPFIPEPVAILNDDITYTLTASTVLGCSTKDTLRLKVVKGPEIYVPSAFTPNGDGKNDRFNIIPVGIEKIRFFKIINRWGQVVYSSENATPGWDGTINGIAQPPGTYVWIAAGKTINGAVIRKQGTVVLIR